MHQQLRKCSTSSTSLASGSPATDPTKRRCSCASKTGRSGPASSNSARRRSSTRCIRSSRRSRTRKSSPSIFPPIQGIGNVGGFQFELEDTRQHRPRQAERARPCLSRAALAATRGWPTSSRRSATTTRNSSSTSTARKPPRSNVPLANIFNTMQIYLGLAVRQRLRLSQPLLPRLRASRDALPFDARGLAEYLRRLEHAARSCRSTTLIKYDANEEPAGHHALQPVPLDRAQRIAGAGVRLRRRHQSDGRDSRASSIRAASATSGRDSRSTRPSPAARRRWSSCSASSSSFSCSRRSTRAGPIRFIILMSVPLAILGALLAIYAPHHLGRDVLHRHRLRHVGHLRAGRLRDADRPGQQERDPDRRVRQPAARAGPAMRSRRRVKRPRRVCARS